MRGFYSLLLLILSSAYSSSSLTPQVTVDLSTGLIVNGVARPATVFGVTVYDSPYLLQFIGDKGQQYIATHSIDRIGAAVSMDRLLPDEKVKWSVNDLEDWFNSSKSVDLFKGLDIYKVLSSKCLEKANVLPYLFLVSHCEGPITYECAPNGTPLGQNGSTLAEKFLWWSTLYHGAVKLIKMADNNIKHVHIWNEPNAHFYHDGYNGSYYAEFYTAIAQRLKATWGSEIQIGGPVTWCPPNGPFAIPHSPTLSDGNYKTWYNYMLPLLDGAYSQGILDFLSYHAYSEDTFPNAILAAINTLNSFVSAKYNKTIQSAISESNIQIFNDTLENNRTFHYIFRTFTLIQATFAMLKNPDMFLERLLFDFDSPGKVCHCRLYNLTDSLEMEMYYLLGRLRDGQRINVEIQQEDSGCTVLAEAVIGSNITLALVNECDQSQKIEISFINQDLPIESSWGGVIDAVSMRDISPVPWPMGTIEVSAKSLTMLSYSLKSYKMAQTNLKSSIEYITVYTTDPNTVMQPIPLNGFEGDSVFNTSVPFIISEETVKSALSASLRFGILGPPGNGTWEVTVNCSGEPVVSMKVVSPGVFYEHVLPSLPSGHCVVHFVTNVTYKITRFLSTRSYPAVFQFSSLVYKVQNNNYI